MSLSQSRRHSIVTSVPNVSDCGLFGTDCDGNSYLEVRAACEAVGLRAEAGGRVVPKTAPAQSLMIHCVFATMDGVRAMCQSCTWIEMTRND